MTPPLPARPGRDRPALLAVLGVLGTAQFLKDRLPRAAGVPVSVAAAGAVLALGHRAGLRRSDIGLSPAAARRGLRDGGAAACAVAALYGAGAALPATRPLFADRRAAPTLPGVLRQALVDVPLGTVLLEEAGFRGVLPALLRPRYGQARAHATAAALFGLWHVLPATALPRANPALARASTAGGTPSTAATAAGNVLATGAAGVLFAALRHRSGSLVAPALLHTALNSLGFLAAHLVNRPRTPGTRPGAPPTARR
ncbi:CPBP family intramembrane glutamic endopeptidase [Streptomyces sp. TRM 70351]|uniref:CPBP family intramembrane glutamic endopeptidase n=1 Tax=Streptomyces sp. TRM 70351 TaxID=3116552 RepID=UPI002E7B657E|nr:CPBP family intramembrane glutamic endopeptidase [Streptomyces sp. TRM 70351]MEE1928645.1 CPBP family intramembrane glutamic endopeptidase [Streptomyces sp. TRM 70351]